MGDEGTPPRRGDLSRALAAAAVVVGPLLLGLAARGSLWSGEYRVGASWVAVLLALFGVAVLVATGRAVPAWSLRRLSAAMLAGAVMLALAWAFSARGAHAWLALLVSGTAALWGLLRAFDATSTPVGGALRSFVVFAALLVAVRGLPGAFPTPSPVRSLVLEPPRCPDGMVYLAGGTFTMGSPEGEPGSNEDERPQHDVTLSPFCVDRTEVTIAAYRECVTAGACEAPTAYDSARENFCNWGRPNAERHPVNCVDATQSQRYCEWRHPHGGSLPTEDQWEFAARGNGGRRYPWGNEPAPSPQHANLCGAECDAFLRSHGGNLFGFIEGWTDPWPLTAPVDALPRAGDTPEGVSGMAGNVWEWTRTSWGRYTSRSGSETEYTGVDRNLRVDRGAGWGSIVPSNARAAFRSRGGAAGRNEGVGFRCVGEGGRVPSTH
ncbi:MAG: SUMF1/EgtB/PvdO family nonheme iron enzyme [Polyangiales bacterium]